MSTKVNLGTLYASEEIPLMLFSSEEDANCFDLILIGYVNNDKAIEEFKRAENQYASDYAVQYNIDNGSFVKNVTGDYSDILIAAAEKMVDSAEDTLPGNDPYTATFNYIRNKLKVKRKKEIVKIKACGCYYDDEQGKRHFGVYFLNHKTSTFTIINKKLEKVTNFKSVVIC